MILFRYLPWLLCLLITECWIIPVLLFCHAVTDRCLFDYSVYSKQASNGSSLVWFWVDNRLSSRFSPNCLPKSSFWPPINNNLTIWQHLRKSWWECLSPPASSASDPTTPIPTGPFTDINGINANQEKYDGNPTKFKVLLMQYSMFLGQKPLLYPTDDSQVSFVCSSGGHWIGPWQFGFPDLRKISFTLLQSIQTSSGMPGGRGSTA